MLLSINPHNPETRKINKVIQTLESGGIIIYPTDAVYGLGCDIINSAAVERICRLRKLIPSKAHLSFICQDISQVSNYTPHIENQVFRLMKNNWPGPFTFILRANNKVPKMFKNKKKTIGVKVPQNPIARAIIDGLGRPILSLSLKNEDEIMPYPTDVREIYDDYSKLVDLLIDGGPGKLTPSAIIDCTANGPELVREGIEPVKW